MKQSNIASFRNANKVVIRRGPALPVTRGTDRRYNFPSR